MRHLLLTSCLFLMAIYGKSQECVDLKFKNQIGLHNSTTCIDLTASGFDSLVLFYFAVEFDTAALSYQTSIPNTSLVGFTLGDITPPTNNDPDLIRVLWSHPNLSPSTLSDETTLLQVCFTLKGNPGDVAFVKISSKNVFGSPSEFLNSNNESLQPCDYTPSNILIVDNTFENDIKIESQGDLYITQSLDGIIMKAVDGACYKTIISAQGDLQSYPIACPN